MATDLGSQDQIGEINKYDFRTKSNAVFKAEKGINADIVRQISSMKDEPEWMLDFRLRSLEIFESKPMPRWGGAIDLDFQDIYYYLKPTDGQGRTWDEVPDEIKNTFERLGIPEAERKYLAGVKAQFESEVVYGSLNEDLAKQGVIFTDTDSALTHRNVAPGPRSGLAVDGEPAASIHFTEQYDGPERRNGPRGVEESHRSGVVH